MANYCIRWRGIFGILKCSHRMGDGRIFLKTLCDTSFNKDLSNEPDFGLIHLSEQYLKTAWTNEHSPAQTSGRVSREAGVNWEMKRGRLSLWAGYTDKKGNKFLIFKEIQRDRVQSHIWLTAISFMVKNLRISSYTRKPFLIYDFAPDPIWISYVWGKFCFLFYQCGGGQALGEDSGR